MSKLETIPVAPTPDEVRATLQRIITSDVFRSSPQLGSFLNFVVEAVLHGKSERIKGYTIGVEVLRRDTKFDPQIDPIVRVEATRLRRALERYYSGPGADELIVVDLPRGSYVPTFRHRAEALLDPDRPIATPKLPRWLLGAGISVLIVTLATTAIFFASRPNNNLGIAGFKQSPGVLPSGNGLPTLVIQTFETIGTPDSRSLSASALFEKVRDAFSAFDGINVVSATDQSGEDVQYRLRGLIEYAPGGSATVRFSLVASDGTIVWSRSFDRVLASGERAAAEYSIAAGIAAPLLQPFGIIKARDRARFLGGGGGDPRYRCLLLAADAFRSFDPTESDRAYSCLESLTALDRSFTDGFSYLASLVNREFVYGFGRSADDPRALDRALQFARRGIELKPNSARAWQVLSTVLFSRRETAAAFTAVQKALALNPNDMIIVAEYGGRLITNGDIERGVEVLQRADSDGGVRPSWHHFYFFLAAYMRGRLAEASHEADEMTSDTYPHGLFARVITASLEGKRDKAEMAWKTLVTLRPAWSTNPRGELEKYIASPAILDRLVRDLDLSGLARAR